MEDKIKYFSLDEARSEIRKRFFDFELKTKIEKELGDKLMFFFDNKKPRSISFRQLISPDNGFIFFEQESRYLDVQPTIVEFLDDKFVSFNEEKKGYGRLRVDNSYIDIINFHESEKKLLKDLKTLNGESLVDFHHSLIKESGLSVDIFDMSNWFHSIGKAKDYYYYFLLHFVAHGALFETFILDSEDERELVFSKEIVLPAIERIKKNFGLLPVIIRMYPDGQTEEEDLYWWSYPLYIKNKIIKYAQDNFILFKPL